MNTFKKKTIYLLAVAATAISAHAGLEIKGTNIVDVGTIYNFYKSTNEFTFVNNGKTDIRIKRLIPTCTCINGSNSTDLVKPGESCKVTTHFDAYSVDGRFSRGIWVFTDEPDNNKTLLRINGEVIPLFKGLPDKEMIYQAKDENIIFTNRFTLIGTTKEFTLGTPTSVPTNSITFDFKKDESATDNTWNLVTRIKPGSDVRQSVVARIPVIGPKPIAALKIPFKLIVGAPLRASPPKLVVTKNHIDFTTNIYITTYNAEKKPELFSYEPHIEGLTVRIAVHERKNRRSSSIFSNFSKNKKRKSRKVKRSPYTHYSCSLSVTQEALAKILEMDKPGITFSYPDHKPVFVEIATLEPKAPPQAK